MTGSSIRIVAFMFFLLDLSSGIATEEMQPQAIRTVMCFGDSITMGHMASREGRWTSLLQKELTPREITVINRGAGGRTTTSGPKDLERYLTESAPVDLLVLLLGVNDMVRVPEDGGWKAVTRCVQNMEVMIDTARKANPGITILLCAPATINCEKLSERHKQEHVFGPHTTTIMRQLAASYGALAEKKQVLFVNLLDVVSPGNYPDGLHPDDAGHAQIYGAVRKAVIQVLDADQP